MEVVQWPDRVIFRYEKDDQVAHRVARRSQADDPRLSLQGFSVGRYEGNALIVDTDHFLFDITGFDDYNGIPSSHAEEGDTSAIGAKERELKVTVTVEDAMFLRKPASYTTRWLPQRPGYKLVDVGLRSRGVARAREDDAVEVQVGRDCVRTEGGLDGRNHERCTDGRWRQDWRSAPWR